MVLHLIAYPHNDPKIITPTVYPLLFKAINAHKNVICDDIFDYNTYEKHGIEVDYGNNVDLASILINFKDNVNYDSLPHNLSKIIRNYVGVFKREYNIKQILNG